MFPKKSVLRLRFQKCLRLIQTDAQIHGIKGKKFGVPSHKADEVPSRWKRKLQFASRCLGLVRKRGVRCQQLVHCALVSWQLPDVGLDRRDNMCLSVIFVLLLTAIVLLQDEKAGNQFALTAKGSASMG